MRRDAGRSGWSRRRRSDRDRSRAGSPWPVPETAERYEVLAEVTSLTEAGAAGEAGATGLIARGMESGGRVSELSAFVLLQQLLTEWTLRCGWPAASACIR